MEAKGDGWGRENYPYPKGAAFIECDELKCVGCGICQMACSMSYQGVFSRAEAWIQVDFDSSKGKYSAFFTPECTNCGLCVENCAFGCLVYAEGK